jgi:hypothetical protein
MSNQIYYILARVGADSIGLYVESPDFDSAYDVAEERIAQRYTGPFTVQALQLIDVGKQEDATRTLGTLGSMDIKDRAISPAIVIGSD